MTYVSPDSRTYTSASSTMSWHFGAKEKKKKLLLTILYSCRRAAVQTIHPSNLLSQKQDRRSCLHPQQSHSKTASGIGNDKILFKMHYRHRASKFVKLNPVNLRNLGKQTANSMSMLIASV